MSDPKEPDGRGITGAFITTTSHGDEEREEGYEPGITGVFGHAGKALPGDGVPTGSWKKAAIEAYLDANGVDRTDATTKDDLLALL